MHKVIDTHCHLYHKQMQPDLDAVVARARAVCSHILLPNIDLSTLAPMNALAAAHPDLCYPMSGLHPCDVSDDFSSTLSQLEAELATGRYIGVGETGIDLYWDKTTLARQQQSLRAHLSWAKSYSLPIVLHSREAFAETIAEVEAAQDGRLTGVFHCFTGTAEEGRRAIAAGFYLGIGGVLTYKSSDLREVIKALPMDRLVLETDAPFLAPLPHRGKRNEPAYTGIVAQHMADALGMEVDELASITSANALLLFTRVPGLVSGAGVVG
jgi:TatD DNase family protein